MLHISTNLLCRLKHNNHLCIKVDDIYFSFLLLSFLVTQKSLILVAQSVTGTNDSWTSNQESYSIGSLSAKWESGNRGPGTISSSYADPGGLSYGTYQISTKHGDLNDFLANEGAAYCEFFTETQPGTEVFNHQWKFVASKDSEHFHDVQHDFIKRTHYDPFIKRLNRQLKLDVQAYSLVLQDVIWSTAVQHGPYSNLVKNALKGHQVSYLSEGEIINLIYNERSKIRNDKLLYFPRIDTHWQSHILQRFDEELAEALKSLEMFEISSTNDYAYVQLEQDRYSEVNISTDDAYTDLAQTSMDNSLVNVVYSPNTTSSHPRVSRTYKPATINIVKRTRSLVEELTPLAPHHVYTHIRSNHRYVMTSEKPAQSYRIILLVLDNSAYVFEDLPQGSVYSVHDEQKSLYKYYVGKQLTLVDAQKLQKLLADKGYRVGRIVEEYSW